MRCVPMFALIVFDTGTTTWRLALVTLNHRRHRLLVSERVWKRAFEHRALSQFLAPLIAVRAKCLVARRGRRDHVTDERIVELKVGNNESGPQQHALVANFELDDRVLI